jgi:hypothetical protein
VKVTDPEGREVLTPIRLSRDFICTTVTHSGDHLHPNEAGLQAIADAFDLQLFSRTGVRSAPDIKPETALSER